jgi:urea transporter
VAEVAASGQRARAAAAVEALLRVYAQVLFSRSPLVGLLVLSATATVPRAFAAGLVAVTTATATARLLGLDPESIRAGDYGYAALLVGLGVGQTFTLGAVTAALLILAAALSVLATAALRAAFAALSLPVLSLPFVITLYLALGAAGPLGAGPRPAPFDPTPFAGAVPAGLALFLRGLGGLFYLPRLDAGALVLAALLVHSRIAGSLAASAFTVVFWLSARFPHLAETVPLAGLGTNAMLAAMALGGVYFVPSSASFLLALAGASIAALSALALGGPFERVGLPLSILPFHVAVLVSLFALRQRVRDLRPKSVDFLPGTPEENLAYYRTRRSRFEWLHAVAFQLPARGLWTVTQAEDGAYTHQGAWRHAFDFEVRDAEDHLSSGEGSRVEEFHCFRLPVVAAADGTVIALEDGVADNAVGAVDLAQNWGNHVLLQHAPGLYSLVAHLAKGSVKVGRGQLVRRGEVLGLCGSSGRSPRPHLHFHLQASPELGAPTLPCHFTDVVEARGDGERLLTAALPREGDAVRNLAPNEEVSAYFDLPLGERLAFQSEGAVESLSVEADLYGRLLFRSLSRPAALFHGRSEAFFTAFDAVGDPDSVVHLLRAALPRVPFEAGASLSWTDHLPARPFRPWPARVVWDVLSPFLARDGVEVDLRLHREGPALVVEGASQKRDRRGEPLLRTRAVLLRGQGPVRIEVTVRGKTRVAERVPPPASDPSNLNDREDLS